MEIFSKEIFKMGKDLAMDSIYSATFISIKEIGLKIALMEKESFTETANYFLKETFKMD
jgi:hypothetical protein